MPPLVIPVIPYIISVLLLQDISPTFSPVYRFNVEINTLFKNVSSDWQGTAGVSFDPKCQLVPNNILRCYIPKDSIYYTLNNDYETDNNFIPSPVNYSHINFTMEFDNTGVTMLDIVNKDAENINSLMMIYAMIGDQLSIGANIEWKEKEFYEWEQTVMGMCPTFYEFLEANHYYPLNYTLSSLTNNEYFKFLQRNSVEIRKNRSVEMCCSNCHRILGMILWTNLFLTTDFDITRTHSESQMVFDRHYFYSTTENLFNISDIKKKFFGHVSEKIEVTLLRVNT